MTRISIRAFARGTPGFWLAFVVFVALAASAPAQQVQPGSYSGISVQASPQIFATMCALEAAGYDIGPSGLANASPARLALRKELLAAQGPAVQELRMFYHDHALEDSAETLSPYITFAVVAGPPPDFEVKGEPQSLPPGLAAIDGFGPVLSAFYAEEKIDRHWAELGLQYDVPVSQYRIAVSRTVTLVNAYLREVLRPSTGRSFTVNFEPLVGARTNFRNVGNAYTVVVGPPSDASADAVRHAYLHFMIDPLVLRNRTVLEKGRTIVDIAARAPQLPREYQGDIVGLLDESLIKAVELRLNHLTPESLQKGLQDEDNSGFVLVRPLIAQLQLFEKAGPAMSYYFGDVIQGIDVDPERKRLQALNARTPAAETVAAAPVKPATEAPAGSELDAWLAEGDGDIAARNVPAAAAVFRRVLAKYPDEPRALYGLAIANLLSGKGEDARDLFEKVVYAAHGTSASEAKPDAATLAWSHVYLGRLHDLADEREEAVKEYQAAQAIAGAPDAARAAAQSGAQDPYKPARTAGGNQQ